MVDINSKGNTLSIKVTSSNNIKPITPHNNSINFYNSIAKDWACKMNSPVEDDNYSSKYYAEMSKSSEEKLINNPEIKIVANDLLTTNHIKNCSENIEVIKDSPINAKIAQDKANEILETSNTKANISLDNLNEAGKQVLLKNSGTGLAVGTIFSHTASKEFVPENSLACDGTEYTKAQFPSLYNDWLVRNKLTTCTYEEYKYEINTTRECLKFGLDEINEKFKVPTKISNKLVYFIVVATDTIKQTTMDWSAWASSLQGKVNTDLANTTVKLADSFVDKTFPDYTAGIDITPFSSNTNQFTVPTYGVINFCGDLEAATFINNIRYSQRQGGGQIRYAGNNFLILVSKGDTFYYSDGRTWNDGLSNKYFPLKGANK